MSPRFIFYFFLNIVLTMTHEEIIMQMSRLSIMNRILKDMKENYDGKESIFYPDPDSQLCVNVPITDNHLIKDVVSHCYHNGVSRNEVYKFFNENKNIYDLMNSLQRDTMLNYRLNELDAQDVFVNTGEYLRVVTRYITAFTPRWQKTTSARYMQLAKTLRQHIERFKSKYRCDKDSLI